MAKRWYVVHVFSGSEKRMAQSILEQAESHGLEEQIVDLMVPLKKWLRYAVGRRYKRSANFPDCILIAFELTDTTWSLFRPACVTGFLGKGKPVPIRLRQNSLLPDG